MTVSFKDRPSAGLANYTTHRPAYPAQSVDEPAAFCPGTRLAPDYGCGAEQLTVPLAERFGRVAGTDIGVA